MKEALTVTGGGFICKEKGYKSFKITGNSGREGSRLNFLNCQIYDYKI